MMQIKIKNINSIEQDLTASWGVKPLKKAENCRFSTTRSPYDSDTLALSNVHIQVIQNIILTILILEANIFELNIAFNWLL